MSVFPCDRVGVMGPNCWSWFCRSVASLPLTNSTSALPCRRKTTWWGMQAGRPAWEALKNTVAKEHLEVLGSFAALSVLLPIVAGFAGTISRYTLQMHAILTCMHTIWLLFGLILVVFICLSRNGFCCTSHWRGKCLVSGSLSYNRCIEYIYCLYYNIP